MVRLMDAVRDASNQANLSIEIGLASLKEAEDFTACTPIEAKPETPAPAEKANASFRFQEWTTFAKSNGSQLVKRFEGRRVNNLYDACNIRYKPVLICPLLFIQHLQHVPQSLATNTLPQADLCAQAVELIPLRTRRPPLYGQR